MTPRLCIFDADDTLHRTLRAPRAPFSPPLASASAHRIEEPCDCRKPAPGMLLAIMGHFGVLPQETLFVGDAECDREAAWRAGVAFIHANRFFERGQGH